MVCWSEGQLTPGNPHCRLTYTCALPGAFLACCSVLPLPPDRGGQALWRMGFRCKFGFMTQIRPEQTACIPHMPHRDARACASSSSVRRFYPVNAKVKPESHLSDFLARNERPQRQWLKSACEPRQNPGAVLIPRPREEHSCGRTQC